MEAGLIKRNLC